MTHVRLVDLAAAHREVADEIEAGFAEVTASGAFVGGKPVGRFELEYAAFSRVRHCVGVANGTDALELALRAAGVGPGTEVVLPANTFVATAEAVVRAGAWPVLADVDPRYHLIDPDAAVTAFGPQTRAVLPVHLYGQVAPVEKLAAAAEAAGVVVIEDAAQAHGASRDGRPAGGWGLAAGTSFYPGKNLGAYGDAGAVLTDDDAVAAEVRLLRDHGSSRRYSHDRCGMNSRLDTLQAVVLSAKLARLAAWNDARRAAAARYDELLAGVAGVTRPATMAGNVHVWHLYVVEVDRRDLVAERLAGAGIGTGIHYPVPVHLQPAFTGLGYRAGAFPVAERAAGRILSLPLHPHLTAGDQEYVVAALRRALS